MRMPSLRRDAWLHVGAAVSVIATIAAVSLSFFTFDRFASFLFNADAIQTPAVFADVMGRGGSFLDWSIAPAPAIVPEYGIFALAYVVGVSYAGRILAYAVIQILVFWAALFGFAWAAGVRRPFVAASLTVSAFGLLCMMRVMDFTQLVQSAFHFGGFILQLIELALILLLWRGSPRASNTMRDHDTTRSSTKTGFLWAGVATLALVASFNDALFVVQLTAPVCLIVGVGVLARRIPWRPGLGLVAVLAVASVSGWRLYPVLMPNPVVGVGNVDLDESGADVVSLVNVWGDALVRSPLSIALIAASVAAGLAGSALLVRAKNFSWMRGTTLPSLAVFALLSGTLPLVAGFVSAAGTSPRYAMPLFYWPVILGAIGLVQLTWRHSQVVAVALACALSVASAGMATRDVTRLGLRAEHYPPPVSCLDEAAEKFDVTHAVGTYWVAKPTQELSRMGLTVTVLTKKLLPRHWISTSANTFATYTAFIDRTSKPDQALRRSLVAHFGKPSHVIDCPGVRMSVWPADTIVLSRGASHELKGN